MRCPFFYTVGLAALLPVAVGHFGKFGEGEGFLLDVVELVDSLLPADKLRYGSGDLHRVNIVISTSPGAPLTRRNYLYAQYSKAPSARKFMSRTLAGQPTLATPHL